MRIYTNNPKDVYVLPQVLISCFTRLLERFCEFKGHPGDRGFTPRGDFLTPNVVFYLKVNRLTQILQQKVGKKIVLFKNYNNLKSWPQIIFPSF